MLVRAAKSARADGVTDIAAMLTYYAFLAVPAALLVSLGLFTVLAGEDTVDGLVGRLDGVVPAEALALLGEGLTRALENASGGIALIVIGAALALWTATGAMGGADARAEPRLGRAGGPSVRAPAPVALAARLHPDGVALVLVLLVLGPVLSGWVGRALDAEGAVDGSGGSPVADPPRGPLRLLRGRALPGPEPRAEAAAARRARRRRGGRDLDRGGRALRGLREPVGSYNKAWGSLAAVIIFLTWLWLSSVALLLGAEVNKEAEREAEEGPGPGRRRATTGRPAP